MGGAMPEICPRCRAFLVAGRPDCPFCGAEGAASAAAPATAPGPSASAPGPSSWGPPGPTAGPPQAPASPPRSPITAGRVLGVLAVILAIGGLVAFLPDPGGKGPSTADAESSTEVQEPQTAEDALIGVCDAEPKPIERAKAFDGKPGRHQLEAILINPDGRWPDLSSGWVPRMIPGARFVKAEDLRLETVELVACYVVTNARAERTCDFSGGFTQELWVVSGGIVVREAKTGREVLRVDASKEEPTECYGAASTDDALEYGYGYRRQLNGVRNLFGDGDQS